MDDLIAWLRGVLDEDAAVIARNRGRDGVGENATYPDYRTYDADGIDAADDYLGQFPPARMAAEVEAKRLRIAVYEHLLADDMADETAAYLVRCETLPYADRPGYREEWRPGTETAGQDTP